MQEYRLTIPCVTVSNGKVIKQGTLNYDGPRFLYKDFPNYTASVDSYGEWSVLSGLCDIILYHRHFCIVELGAGESSKILGQAAQKANVKFYSVDKNERKKYAYKDTYYFHLMDSEKFMETFNDTPAIVLIDANHRYEIAKKEFEFFFDKLVEGGVIFLHDTYPPCEEMLLEYACSDVYRLRQDIEKMDKNLLDVFTWPYTAKWCGLTMVIKKEKERPYWGI